MEDLAGIAVRVTPDRHRVDEWATVLAAGGISHRLRSRLDGWALIVAARDADAARETLDAYDRENIADTERAPSASVGHVRGAAGVGVAVGLLLIGFFAVTGTRANRSAWFERGGADAERIVAGEWWRTVTALTLHADAPHVVGNAGASAVLVGAVGHQLGPGVGLCVLLLAGAGGNASPPPPTEPIPTRAAPRRRCPSPPASSVPRAPGPVDGPEPGESRGWSSRRVSPC